VPSDLTTLALKPGVSTKVAPANGAGLPGKKFHSDCAPVVGFTDLTRCKAGSRARSGRQFDLKSPFSMKLCHTSRSPFDERIKPWKTTSFVFTGFKGQSRGSGRDPSTGRRRRREKGPSPISMISADTELRCRGRPSLLGDPAAGIGGGENPFGK
jgi:hypothetical protein